MVAANVTTTQQFQLANKFAVLGNKEGETDEANQLALVNPINVSSPTAATQANGRSLNATAPAFDLKASGTKARKERNGTKEAEYTGEKTQEQRKESTSQWVNRTFALNNVTMNQSCQEIPSQATDPEEIAEQELLKKKVNWTGGKLWNNQTEEDPDEGDLSEGYEEEVVPEEETQGEEVRVNGNTNKGETDTPNLTPDPNITSPTHDPIIAEPIDPGDTGGGEKQQNAEKVGVVERETAGTDVQNEDDQNAKQLDKENVDKSMIPKPTENQIAAGSQAYLRTYYPHERQKSNKESKIQQEEVMKIFFLMTIYRNHRYLQRILDSNAANLIGASTCNINEAKQGILLVSSITYRAWKSNFYHHSKCSRYDGAELSPGIKASQHSHAAADNNHRYTRDHRKRRDNNAMNQAGKQGKSGTKMSFKGICLVGVNYYDRSRYDQIHTGGVKRDVSIQLNCKYSLTNSHLENTCGRKGLFLQVMELARFWTNWATYVIMRIGLGKATGTWTYLGYFLATFTKTNIMD
ncbi:hypothetical protein A4A49_24121 [Nicotiana attenuata]|uniref:Uncharacterized protein n=1 Tax=Nicotiana attenuata TaxID=49451 RepID=A0A1J6IH67_NICAT|nr:hypothetical protein A4A49_24121 [Nicotiana attenuata]